MCRPKSTPKSVRTVLFEYLPYSWRIFTEDTHTVFWYSSGILSCLALSSLLILLPGSWISEWNSHSCLVRFQPIVSFGTRFFIDLSHDSHCTKCFSVYFAIVRSSLSSLSNVDFIFKCKCNKFAKICVCALNNTMCVDILESETAFIYRQKWANRAHKHTRSGTVYYANTILWINRSNIV